MSFRGFIMTTVFIAQFLGLFFLFVSLGALFNQDHAGKGKDSAGHAGSGGSVIVALLLGLFVVLNHTSWGGWDIVVTLTGWFLLVMSVVKLWFPHGYDECVKKYGGISSKFKAMFFFILSLLLLYVGFVV